MWVCHGSTTMAWLRKRASKESLITTSVLATRQLVWRIVGPEKWLLVYPLHVYSVALNQIMPSIHTYKYFICPISAICFQAFKMNRTLPLKWFSDSTGHHSRKRNCHCFFATSTLVIIALLNLCYFPKMQENHFWEPQVQPRGGLVYLPCKLLLPAGPGVYKKGRAVYHRPGGVQGGVEWHWNELFEDPFCQKNGWSWITWWC